MKDKQTRRVLVKIQVGHVSELLSPPNEHGHTHRWTVFVRPIAPARFIDRSFVNKVVFSLHPSFANPKRVTRDPPFEVTETGYGSFTFPIFVTFNHLRGKEYRIDYDLNLLTDKANSFSVVHRIAVDDPPRMFTEMMKVYCNGTNSHQLAQMFANGTASKDFHKPSPEQLTLQPPPIPPCIAQPSSLSPPSRSQPLLHTPIRIHARFESDSDSTSNCSSSNKYESDDETGKMPQNNDIFERAAQVPQKSIEVIDEQHEREQQTSIDFSLLQTSAEKPHLVSSNLTLAPSLREIDDPFTPKNGYPVLFSSPQPQSVYWNNERGVSSSGSDSSSCANSSSTSDDLSQVVDQNRLRANHFNDSSLPNALSSPSILPQKSSIPEPIDSEIPSQLRSPEEAMGGLDFETDLEVEMNLDLPSTGDGRWYHENFKPKLGENGELLCPSECSRTSSGEDDGVVYHEKEFYSTDSYDTDEDAVDENGKMVYRKKLVRVEKLRPKNEVIIIRKKHHALCVRGQARMKAIAHRERKLTALRKKRETTLEQQKMKDEQQSMAQRMLDRLRSVGSTSDSSLSSSDEERVKIGNAHNRHAGSQHVKADDSTLNCPTNTTATESIGIKFKAGSDKRKNEEIREDTSEFIERKKKCNSSEKEKKDRQMQLAMTDKEKTYEKKRKEKEVQLGEDRKKEKQRKERKEKKKEQTWIGEEAGKTTILKADSIAEKSVKCKTAEEQKKKGTDWKEKEKSRKKEKEFQKDEKESRVKKEHKPKEKEEKYLLDKFERKKEETKKSLKEVSALSKMKKDKKKDEERERDKTKGMENEKEQKRQRLRENLKESIVQSSPHKTFKEDRTEKRKVKSARTISSLFSDGEVEHGHINLPMLDSPIKKKAFLVPSLSRHSSLTPQRIASKNTPNTMSGTSRPRSDSFNRHDSTSSTSGPSQSTKLVPPADNGSHVDMVSSPDSSNGGQSPPRCRGQSSARANWINNLYRKLQSTTDKDIFTTVVFHLATHHSTEIDFDINQLDYDLCRFSDEMLQKLEDILEGKVVMSSESGELSLLTT